MPCSSNPLYFHYIPYMINSGFHPPNKEYFLILPVFDVIHVSEKAYLLAVRKIRQDTKYILLVFLPSVALLPESSPRSFVTSPPPSTFSQSQNLTMDLWRPRASKSLRGPREVALPISHLCCNLPDSV